MHAFDPQVFNKSFYRFVSTNVFFCLTNPAFQWNLEPFWLKPHWNDRLFISGVRRYFAHNQNIDSGERHFSDWPLAAPLLMRELLQKTREERGDTAGGTKRPREVTHSNGSIIGLKCGTVSRTNKSSASCMCSLFLMNESVFPTPLRLKHESATLMPKGATFGIFQQIEFNWRHKTCINFKLKITQLLNKMKKTKT